MNAVSATMATRTSPSKQQVLSPGEVRLRADLDGERFLDGVRAGKWRNPLLAWPHLTLEVAVGDHDYVMMRLLVDEYPTRAPGGRLWNERTGAPLPTNLWPRGGEAEKVFRLDWSPTNQGAPYLPCDRTGLSTHTGWAVQYSARAWNASRSISFYLEEIYGELTEAVLPHQEQA